MTRIFYILGTAAILLVAYAIVNNALQDPLAERRVAFAEQLDQVPLTPAAPSDDGPESARLRIAVAAKPSLWDALVEEKVIPPPPPRPPNLITKLKGVTVTRQRIGDAVKVILPKEPKGVWVSKGEEIINGCVLKDFDKFSAIVSFYWAFNNEELTVELVRK